MSHLVKYLKVMASFSTAARDSCKFVQKYGTNYPHQLGIWSTWKPSNPKQKLTYKHCNTRIFCLNLDLSADSVHFVYYPTPYFLSHIIDPCSPLLWCHQPNTVFHNLYTISTICKHLNPMKP